ncbi:MAG: hypothetical protein DRJ32_00650 [Thermoprotei archaeon]|nr:MAG: hypothetical protein DRJ32_00650 [Thermoprotei archaeon]HDD63999.1 hypothetical protein [Thermoprotei archaeon]
MSDSSEFLGISRKAFLTAILISIILPIVLQLNYALLFPYTYAEWGWMKGPWIVTLILGLFIGLLSRVSNKFRISKTDFTVIYAAILISSVFYLVPSYTLGWFTYMVYDEGRRLKILGGEDAPFMPDLWVPKSIDVLVGMFKPGRPYVPWGAWAGPLGYWIVFFIALGLVQIGIATILRKQFIEIERLPFPYAMAGIDIWRASNIAGFEERPGKIFGINSLWLGALLAFILYLPGALASLSAGAISPPQAYWDNIWPGWGIDLSPVITYNVALRVSLSPAYISLALLWPMEILITAVVWYALMYIVLPPIQVFAGVTTIFETQYAHENYYRTGHWYGALMVHFVTRGMIVGLAIVTIAFSWRLFKDAFKGGKIERTSSILIIVGLVLDILLLLAAGVDAWAAVFLPVFAILLYITFARVRAEAGWDTCYGTYGPWYHEMVQLPYIPYQASLTYNTPQACRSVLPFIPLVTDRALVAMQLPPVMEAYKIASETKVSPKVIFKISIISMVISVVIGFILTVWGAYTYVWDIGWVGAADKVMWSDWVSAMIYEGQVIHQANDWRLWMPQFISGIVLAGFIEYARRIFIWFPFSVAGIILGDAALTGSFMFIPNLLAFVIKFVAIRFGGVKVYENYIRPFCTGFFTVSWIMVWLNVIGVRHPILAPTA